MSRTRKDRNNQWRYVKNALMKKTLHCYSEDIVGKRKNRVINRILRSRLKKQFEKEIIGGENE